VVFVIVRARALAVLAIASVALAAAAWAWSRKGDPIYDDDRLIAKHAANPPRALEVPDDVSLPRVDFGSDVDPKVIGVSLGKSSVRVGAQIVLDRLPYPLPADSGSPTDFQLYDALSPMVRWAGKLNAAVGAPRDEVNLLFDENAKVGSIFQLLAALSRSGIAGWRVIVRTPTGLGVLPAPSFAGGLPLSHALCVSEEGARVVERGSSKKSFGHDCVEGASGVVARFVDGRLDAKSLRACVEKLEHIELEEIPPPSEDGTMDARALVGIRVGTSLDFRFAQHVALSVALWSIGLAQRESARCDW
jgi:hypothetical protein